MATIRRSKPSDIEQVLSLTKDFSTSFAPARPVFVEAFARLATREDAVLLVAEDSSRVVAYLLGVDHDTLFANGRVSWVEEVMVHQEYRRRGIGKRLMQEFERWAESRQSRLVALATRRASHFYKALGYEESATYYRKPVGRRAHHPISPSLESG